MATLSVKTDAGQVDVDIDISADWLSCLIPALLAGLPAFLDAFMKCIAGGGASGDYNPGNRTRCN